MGDAVAMTLSLCGAGALLRASSAAFATLKSLGALYLLYLGARAILNARRSNAQEIKYLALGKPEPALARFTREVRPAQGSPGALRAVSNLSRIPAWRILTAVNCKRMFHRLL